MSYFAHSSKGDVAAQAYAAHIQGVCFLAEKFAQEAGEFSKNNAALLRQTAKNAAEFHDLGKLDPANQDVLSGKTSAKVLPVNHVDAGAAHWAGELSFSLFSAAVIQAHHIGFPDFSSEQKKGELMFRDEEIATDMDNQLPRLEKIHRQLIGSSSHSFIEEQVNGDYSVFLRMLLSCIADADHTDTARHYGRYPESEKMLPLQAEERLNQLNECVKSLPRPKDQTERNILRSQMYQSCRDAVIFENICSCDSPVGSGKTTAVMAHMLAQAQKRGLRRIFVVLPFTNIIQQSVRIYRKMLTLPGENPEEVVAELHHRIDFESEDTRHLTSLWRAPIIVTTAVSFFETLASNSPASLRKLHELPGSAIFVDESHAALPATLLPIAWRWIRILSEDWNCYWVLASGSMSRFWTIEEIADEEKDFHVPELVCEEIRKKLATYEENRITYCNDYKPKTTNELAHWVISFEGPRLVILNTIQSAAVLADSISQLHGREKVEHISTALTPNDRAATLKRVINRLKNPEDTDWTLVATSCVEAGVDLSFKIGFREIGSLSSLLQAAGRVNREGIDFEAPMWSFRIAEDGMLKSNPALLQPAKVLRGYFADEVPICPQLTTRSISDEIALYGLGGKHRDLIKNETLQNFKSVQHDFKVIDSDTRIAVVDADVAQKLRDGEMDWRELQKVSVQIARYKLNKIRAPMIGDNIYHWNLGYDDFLGYMAGIINLKNTTDKR